MKPEIPELIKIFLSFELKSGKNKKEVFSELEKILLGCSLRASNEVIDFVNEKASSEKQPVSVEEIENKMASLSQQFFAEKLPGIVTEYFDPDSADPLLRTVRAILQGHNENP